VDRAWPCWPLRRRVGRAWPCRSLRRGGVDQAWPCRLLRRNPSGGTYHESHDTAPSCDALAHLWPSALSLPLAQTREGEAWSKGILERGFWEGDINEGRWIVQVWAGPNEPPRPGFGNTTTSPSNVWFAQVKKQVVGQDIELLSYANLYYPAFVACTMGCTCSYHILVKLPNLVKSDHKFFVQLHVACFILVTPPNLYKHAHQKLQDQQCSFSHITRPTNPHKSSQNGKLQCSFSWKWLLIVTADLSCGTSFIFTAVLKKCVIFFIFIFTFTIMHFFFSNF
jgi:hypothetical protein